MVDVREWGRSTWAVVVLVGLGLAASFQPGALFYMAGQMLGFTAVFLLVGAGVERVREWLPRPASRPPDPREPVPGSTEEDE